jgi:transposase-like protein
MSPSAPSCGGCSPSGRGSPPKSVRTASPWAASATWTKCSSSEAKRYLYRVVDEHGQVVDVLFREQRDTEAATAFFRQALARTGWRPTQVLSDHHQPYVKAVQEVLLEAEHVRTGLHRARGETTKPIERSHVFTRDRLHASRGLKTLPTGQRCFEGFEALHALRRGHTRLAPLVSPGLPWSPATSPRAQPSTRVSVPWPVRSPRLARVSPKRSPQHPDGRARRATLPQAATVTCRPTLTPVLRPQHPAMSRTPQHVLLPSCDLVVNQAGFSTITGALREGLPMVLLPISADQPYNASCCAALGIGRVVEPGKQTPDAIRAGLHEVLADERFRTSAQRVRDEMRALPGSEHAVHLLERLAESRQPVLAEGTH